MSERLLSIYHSLPVGLRSLAVNLRGLYLERLRYGRDTERLVQEAFEREFWSAGQWQRWQAQRLAFVLKRAAATVPYYRRLWEGRGRVGDESSSEFLRNWPLLGKEEVRKDPRAFVADDCRIDRMVCENTSGTTGTPLKLWWSRETVRRWYALVEARWRRWYGVSMKNRWGILGGQLILDGRCRRPPFWIWNAPMKQLYLSSYHLYPEFLGDYAAAIQRYKVDYLYGYPSALYTLALGILDSGRRRMALTVVITDAEPLYDHQRKVISEVFQCPVYETYGMAEIVAAAGECAAGRLHLWPEVGHVEVVEGELVCTGLFNTDMPLIRYRVGDRGTVSAEGAACECGRRLPVLASLEGRVDDVVVTPDGRSIGRLDPIFKSSLPIREAQIVQESANALRVRYVPAEGWSEEAARLICSRLQDKVGAMEITLEAVTHLPRGANGKFRAVVNKVGKS